MDQTKRECAVCQKPAKHRCSRCVALYCSPECQKKDWKAHKLVCGPQAAKDSPKETVKENAAKPAAKGANPVTEPTNSVSQPVKSASPANPTAQAAPAPVFSLPANPATQPAKPATHKPATQAKPTSQPAKAASKQPVKRLDHGANPLLGKEIVANASQSVVATQRTPAILYRDSVLGKAFMDRDYTAWFHSGEYRCLSGTDHHRFLSTCHVVPNSFVVFAVTDRGDPVAVGAHININNMHAKFASTTPEQRKAMDANPELTHALKKTFQQHSPLSIIVTMLGTDDAKSDLERYFPGEASRRRMSWHIEHTIRRALPGARVTTTLVNRQISYEVLGIDRWTGGIMTCTVKSTNPTIPATVLAEEFKPDQVALRECQRQ